MMVGQIEQYNMVDQQYVEVQLAAEQQCWKFHAGKVPWTPSLTQAIYHILYWKGIWKHISGSQIATSVLQQRAQRGQLVYQPQHVRMTQVDATIQIKEAAKDYLQIKKQVDQRYTWLGQLTEAQAAATGTSNKS